jgi:SAM-dependent methyltransferase
MVGYRHGAGSDKRSSEVTGNRTVQFVPPPSDISVANYAFQWMDSLFMPMPALLAEPIPHDSQAGVMDESYARLRRTSPALRFRLQGRALVVVRAWMKHGGHRTPRILDLGAAEGRTLVEIAGQLGHGHHVGVELDDGLIAAGGRLPFGIRLIKGDVCALPDSLDCGSFDIVSLLAVLEHLQSPIAALREAGRMLHPGGIMVATCPNPTWDRVAGRLGLVRDDHHVQRLNLYALRELVTQAGLEIVEARRFMWAPVASLAYLGRRFLQVGSNNRYRCQPRSCCATALRERVHRGTQTTASENRMNQTPLKLRHFTPILIGITLAAMALRLYRLDVESLCMDEIVTVETFHRDPQGVVLAAAIVGQPPLDNFIGATLYRLGLGQSDWWVRFPAVIFGSGAVLLLGVWARRLASDVTGLVAALLLAVCPMHVYMSQEVRPYALMFFLAIGCGLCYIRARERNRLADWVIFAAVMLAMLMTRWTDPHFVVMGIGLHALFVRVRASPIETTTRKTEASIFRRTAMSAIVAYACYAPFFLIVLHFHHSTSIRSPSMDWTLRFGSLLLEAFAALFAGYSTRTVFVALPGSRWLVLTGALLTLIGLLAALLRYKQTHSAFWCIFLPFPFVYAFVYALLGNAIPKPQYLLVMAVFVFACIALALDTARACLKRPAFQVAFLTVLLLLLAVPMARASWDGLTRIDKRDWRGAMGFLKQHAERGDVAVCLGSDTVPPAFRPKAYGKDRYGSDYLHFIPVSTDTPLSLLAGAEWPLRQHRLMLVYTDRMYTGRDLVVPPEQVGSIKSIRSFNGLFLAELGRGKPAIDRLMDTIGAWYAVLPAEASIPAPAMLRWRWAVSRGDTHAAATSLEAARGQCAGAQELAALEQLVRAGEALAGSEP